MGVIAGIAVIGVGVLIWAFSTGKFKFFAAGEQLTLTANAALYTLAEPKPEILISIGSNAPSGPALQAVQVGLSWVADKDKIKLTNVQGGDGYTEGSFDLTAANSTGLLTFNIVKDEGDIPAQVLEKIAQLTFEPVSAGTVTINVVSAKAKNTSTQQTIDLTVLGTTFDIMAPVFTSTSTATFTETSTATATSTGTSTGTSTPKASDTPTPTATATDTSTNTMTYTPSDTPTDTPTDTATFTPSDTSTPTATATQTSEVILPTETFTTTSTVTQTEMRIETPTVTQVSEAEGDIDGDGVATRDDLRLMVNFIVGSQTPTTSQLQSADLAEPFGEINREDMRKLVDILVGT